MKLSLRLAPVVTAIALVACGGTTKSAGPGDAGPDSSRPQDSGKPDGTMQEDTGAGDSAPPPIPTGTWLLPSDTIQALHGVTSDGYAIYSEVTGTKVESIFAISIAGGTPKKIIDLDAAAGVGGFVVLVEGSVVLVWPGVSKNDVGALSVWTSTGGVHQLSTLSYFLVSAVSADNKSVLFTSNVNSAGLQGDLYVAGVDGSSPTALVTGISLQGSCAALAGFSGSYAVASYCTLPEPADGGAPDAGEDAGPVEAGAADAGAGEAGVPSVATLSNFAGPTWTRTDMLLNLSVSPKQCATAATMANGQSVLTGCGLWSGDKGGTKVIVTTGAGELQALPLPTGAPINVDTIGANQFGILRSDGTAVLYATAAKSLKQSPLPAAAPTTLVPSGVTGITQLSQDDNWALYYQNRDSTTGISDLYLSSTVTPGTPITLSSAMTAITFAIDFTTDSKYAVYYADAVQLPAMGAVPSPGLVGTLTTMPVAGGKANTIAANVWSNLSAAGSKVVFQGNYVPAANPVSAGQGIADILSVDVSGSAAPTLIVPQADATGVGGPLLTSTLDKIVYTFSSSGANAGDAGNPDSGPDLNGLYIVPVP
jgi:hypothetical protein